MIRIRNKTECCGCGACVQICPVRCISMREDAEGFAYPHADADACTGCGLCEKVCPVAMRLPERAPLRVLAARNTDDRVRRESSSGGIFLPLARKVIRMGGVVFGARFGDDGDVFHDFTADEDGLYAFTGSKYVQSMIGESYVRARDFLRKGRPVLFTGTQCQIKGLRLFLMKDWDNLYTADILCHGVPSPAVWRAYLNAVVCPPSSAVAGPADGPLEISFRDKSRGWKNYRVVIRSQGREVLNEAHSDNLYMRMYLADLMLRPSCHDCRAKDGRSGSDLTIADFWGIDRLMPALDDDGGTGLILINSSKGAALFQDALKDGAEQAEVRIDAARPFNGGFQPVRRVPAGRRRFFRRFAAGKEDILRLFSDTLNPAPAVRLWLSFVHRLRKRTGRLFDAL